MKLITCANVGCTARFHPRWQQRYCSHACANQASGRARTLVPAPDGSMSIRQIAERYHYSYIGVWCIIHRSHKLRGGWVGQRYLVSTADVAAAEQRGVFRRKAGQPRKGARNGQGK